MPRSAPGPVNADSLLQLVPGGKGLGRKPGSMGDLLNRQLCLMSEV